MSGTATNQDYSVSTDEPTGWAAFASMMMFGISLFAALAFIVGLVNDSVFLDNSLFGAKVDWIWYGVFDLINCIAAAYAGYAIWKMQGIGFILGLIFATLSAGRWFLFIPAFPIWSLSMVIVWILVMYGLIKDADHFS